MFYFIKSIKPVLISFTGENPGMVDYMIWPWFERIGMFKVLYGDKFDFPKEKLPNLVSKYQILNHF